MKTKTILLCTVALSLGACSSNNNHPMSGPRYTPRAEVSQNNYTPANHMADRMDTKSYREYEQREQCERYRRLPRNYADSCDDTKLIPVDVVMPVEKIVSSYTILFDHDKSGIRVGENETLDRAMREISRYNPRHVTVTGYTDSSGKAEYNQTLSREREQAVSHALLERGIANQVLDREARGEYDQAVQTKDGIRNQENRRVVIDFLR